MRDKIEMTQSDLAELLKEKIDFLNKEYINLYKTFSIDKKKPTVDTVLLTESYERYLKESGDIERILKMYDIFVGDNKTTKSTSKRSTNKTTTDSE